VKDDGVSDTGNEHFLAFNGPDGSLMAVWTQISDEIQPDQQIAFARSDDEGVTWTKPRVIADPTRPGEGHMASWGYPLISKNGRIYVLYSHRLLSLCPLWNIYGRGFRCGFLFSQIQFLPQEFYPYSGSG
jgi:hypothetical protein